MGGAAPPRCARAAAGEGAGPHLHGRGREEGAADLAAGAIEGEERRRLAPRGGAPAPSSAAAPGGAVGGELCRGPRRGTSSSPASAARRSSTASARRMVATVHRVTAEAEERGWKMTEERQIRLFTSSSSRK